MTERMVFENVLFGCSWKNHLSSVPKSFPDVLRVVCKVVLGRKLAAPGFKRMISSKTLRLPPG